MRAVYHVWSTLDRRRVYITLNFRGRRRLRPTNCSRVDSDDDSGTDSARTTTTAMHTFIAAWLLCLIQCQVGVFGRSVDDGHQRNAWNKAGGHYTDDRGNLLARYRPLYPLTDGVSRARLERKLEPALLKGKLPTKTLGRFHAVGIPTHFSDYDRQPRDGVVTVEELIKATGAYANARLAFRASDIDGRLTGSVTADAIVCISHSPR